MKSLYVYGIAVLALAIASCGGISHALSSKLVCITPIKNSESFYAIRCVDTMTVGYGSRNEFVRIDNGGVLTTLSVLDSSVSPYRAGLINDSTLIYQSYRQNSIHLYNINSRKHTDLLAGCEFETIAEGRKHFITRNSTWNGRKRSYRIVDDTIQEIGSMTYGNRIYFTYGDSGYCFIDGNKFEPEDTMPETINIVGPDLLPLYSFPTDLTYSPLRSLNPDADKAELLYIRFEDQTKDERGSIISYNLLNQQTDTLFQGMYFTKAIALRLPNLYLLNGKTIEELTQEYKSEAKYWDELGKEGAKIFITPSKGYWLLANSKTKKMKKIGFEEWQPTVSSTNKSIMFMKSNSSTRDFSVKIVPIEDYLPDN